MISNDQYFGDTRAWQEETGIDINTDREAPKFENKNFGDSLPLKHNLTGRLRLGRLLGRGEFGEVYEGVSTDSDGTWKKVAVKKLKGIQYCCIIC